MKTIFLKDSNIRKKEFAVKTRIVLDNNKKLAIKEACYIEGFQHLINIVNSKNKFVKYYSNVKIAKTWIKDDKLYSEYIEGKSLSDLYIDAINKKDKNKLQELIKYQFDLLLGNDNKCKFKMTDEFKTIFGDSINFDRKPAFLFTFFETDPANIIFLKNDLNKPCFIDYEWFYDFPIPVSLLGFRLIQQLSSIPGFDNIITIEERARIINCNFSFNEGMVLLNNFFSYIYINKSINYLLINNKYIKSVKTYSDLNYDDTNKICQLYFDTGKGYNENEKVTFSFRENTADITCHIPPNTKSVRLDPLEGYGCIVSNLEIFSYNGIVKYKPLNGCTDNNGNLIFTNIDPQIEMKDVLNWIKISYRILLLNDVSHYKVFDNYIKVSHERNSLTSERDGLVTERKNLTAERDGLVVERNCLSEERNSLIVERNNLAEEREELVTKQNKLKEELDELVNICDSFAICYPSFFSPNCTLYFDTGNGYSESNKITRFFSGKEVNISFSIPENTKSIRLDPIEGYGCIIRNFEIISDKNDFKYEPINGFLDKKGDMIFSNNDPQIKLNGDASWLNIKYQILLYKLFEDSIIISQERDRFFEERNRLIQDRDSLLASRSWRFTKPLRKLTDFIRRKKTLYLFAKGILSIKRVGIKKTIKKIIIYSDNKKQFNDFKKYIYLTKNEINYQKNTMFSKNIKISIITPLFNTPEIFLKEMIESVLWQTYLNWELCLSDGSDNKHNNVMRICKKYAENDKRIKYKKLDKNEGISENSNRAIEMSTGDYLGLLDHDDVLHPSALFEVMKVICEEDADFIYTDEATFSDKKIVLKHHKPNYAIDTLRSLNYICHFSVFSKNLINEAGVFRKEFDGSQDYDLILRYTDIAKNINHIPKLLYFWRSHENSTASGIKAKIYTVNAAKNAIKEHLTHHNLSAIIESTAIDVSFYRLKYYLFEQPLVSIVILNKDNIILLKKCINSIIEKSTYKNIEIIIIENNSIEHETFTYYDELKKYNNIKVIYWEGKGFNYSLLNNFALPFCNGTHLLFLNNDIEIITPNWIEEMLMFSQRNDVGAVGIKLYFSDDTIQHAGVILGMGGVAGHIYPGVPRDTVGYIGKLHLVQNMTAVTAACMMVKKSVFLEVNLFSTEFFASWSDIDLCLKIRRAGYLIVWTPFAEVYHYESKTRGYPDTLEKQIIFRQEISTFKEKWEEELVKGDPYYNCNFSLERADYFIKNNA